MTSIVITPFDSEHTEELKEFLWKVIDRADFNDVMPPSVRLVDVQALEAEHKQLLAALEDLLTMPEPDGTRDMAMVRVKAKHRARDLIKAIKETQ